MCARIVLPSTIAAVLSLAACDGKLSESGPRPTSGIRCLKLTTGAPQGPATVLLNFDGVTLTKATRDDARMNQSALVEAEAVIPPFREGQPGREAVINEIVAHVKQQLAAWKVEIRRDRPASGEYIMVVVGGDADSVGRAPGSLVGLAAVDCGNAVPGNVALVFDIATLVMTPVGFANQILFSIAAASGVSPTLMPGSCSCQVCVQRTALCSLSEMSVPEASSTCPGSSSENEYLVLERGFGCR